MASQDGSRRGRSPSSSRPCGTGAGATFRNSGYLFVDVHRELAPDADPDNLVALLFALERSRSHEEIDRGIARLAEILRGPEGLELRRAFTAFLRYSLLPARFPGARIPAIQDLEEVRPMLRETVQEWTQQWLEEGFQQGRQQGLQEGRQEGRQEGEATASSPG